MPNCLLQWFQSHLTQRCQRIKIDGCVSSWRLLNGGMPQGSRLGPLSFIALIGMRNFDHVYFAEILMRNVPQIIRCSNSAFRIPQSILARRQWYCDFVSNQQYAICRLPSSSHGSCRSSVIFYLLLCKQAVICL